MTFFFYVYLVVFIASFVTSLIVYKYTEAIRVVSWFLGIGVFMEIIASIIYARFFGRNPFPIYHALSPVFFFFQGYFFFHVIKDELIKRLLFWVIIASCIVSYCLSIFFYKWYGFPGLSININALILISASTYVLLTLDPIHHIPIYKHPLAWISIGLIIFYGSVFFLNGIYNYLVQSKSEGYAVVHAIINNGSNCIQYLCITVGLLFSHRLKKYAVQAQ